MLDTLYVHIRHWLFWYGNYGFCDKSCNDEITIFADEEKSIELGYFEITTNVSLEYLLENEIDKLNDKEFYYEIENFLKSDSSIYYSYIYPRDKEDILNQVKHKAPVNIKGLKPVYIQMWTKLSQSWDIEEIKGCVKILAKEFLDLEINRVEILDTPTYEATRLSYEEDYAPYVK